MGKRRFEAHKSKRKPESHRAVRTKPEYAHRNNLVPEWTKDPSAKASEERGEANDLINAKMEEQLLTRS